MLVGKLLRLSVDSDGSMIELPGEMARRWPVFAACGHACEHWEGRCCGCKPRTAQCLICGERGPRRC